MLMTPIEPVQPSSSYLIVRLLRRWSSAGAAGHARLPSLVNLAVRLGQSPEAAIAIASLFELTEACLGRSLEPECCCSPRLSRDERAVLTMLAVPTPSHPHLANAAIPHGLPGALLWAVASVRQLLGECAWPPSARLADCPFGPIQAPTS